VPGEASTKGFHKKEDKVPKMMNIKETQVHWTAASFCSITKHTIVHFDVCLFQSRAKLKNQQKHQHNQEQPTSQIVPHISSTAPKWHQNTT